MGTLHGILHRQPSASWVTYLLLPKRLAKFPKSAKEIFQSPGHSIRALSDPPYQILYEIRENLVLIVAVVHGHRDLSALLTLIKERR